MSQFANDISSIFGQFGQIVTGQTTATAILNDPNYQNWQNGSTQSYSGPSGSNDNLLGVIIVGFAILIGVSMLGGRRR
jgi:hypothetical protein